GHSENPQQPSPESPFLFYFYGVQFRDRIAWKQTGAAAAAGLIAGEVDQAAASAFEGHFKAEVSVTCTRISIWPAAIGGASDAACSRNMATRGIGTGVPVDWASIR